LKNILYICLLVTPHLYANNLNSHAIGRGGVDIAIGGSAKSILINPANLDKIVDKNLTIELIDSSIALNRDSLNFLTSLSTSHSSSQVSALMDKNIGKLLSITSDNLTSIYQKIDNYSWLIGLYSNIDGYFITHTGFGSIGAMESFIDKYNLVISTFNFNYKEFVYGFNIRAVERSQIRHNYSISEIIENNNIFNYFSNRYTQKEKKMAFDVGGVYKISDSELALSILDIGDTNFNRLGRVKSTTNIGYSNRYKNTLYGIDYLDIFGDDSVINSIRVGCSKEFFNKKMKLSSGILYQSFTFGVDYFYKIVNISLSSYKNIKYNSRNYQLAISFKW